MFDADAVEAERLAFKSEVVGVLRQALQKASGTRGSVLVADGSSIAPQPLGGDIPKGIPPAEGLQGSRSPSILRAKLATRPRFKIDAVESKGLVLAGIRAAWPPSFGRFAAPLAGTGRFGPYPMMELVSSSSGAAIVPCRGLLDVEVDRSSRPDVSWAWPSARLERARGRQRGGPPQLSVMAS